MAVAAPTPLSVAPVPACQLSRCAPIMTISSFFVLSVPGISAKTFEAASGSSSVKRAFTSTSSSTSSFRSRRRATLP